ncbi:hypothetical protein C4577_00435 [Candidatus Parcubacteria bacterium]|nr:MAG: hypothetical protein C4577_00435 [Candidatus Parcubacteria bacterium]
MLTLYSVEFWLNFAYFFIAIFLAFFVPGSILLQRIPLSVFQHIVLAIILGMVLWAWQGFIFGYLELRWLSYLYLIFAFTIWIKNRNSNLFLKKIPLLPNIRSNFLPFILILSGMIIQLLSTFFIGISYKDGIYFCCSLPDSLYHLALTNQLIKQVPPIEPGASEIFVKNYHYFSNLLIAELIRVFHLPLLATSYQYIVLLFSLLHGLTAIVFAQILRLKNSYTNWLLFFLYFSGDLTFLLLFFVGKGFDFSLPFLENGFWFWISPPRVIASVIFFGALSLFIQWEKKKSIFLGFLLGIIFGSLVGFKAYVGFFSLIGISCLSIYYFISKKSLNYYIPFISTLLSFIIIYFAVSENTGGLIFTGLWRFENFIVSPQLELSHLELARQIYLQHNNWPRNIQYGLMYIFIYFTFVFGTINVGIFQTKRSLSLIGKELNIFLIGGTIFSVFAGSFFIQKTGGANSSQFLITVIIIFSIYAALACYYWLKKTTTILKYTLIILLVILTIPRITYSGISTFYKLYERQGFFIDNSELAALSYLKNQTDPSSIILVDNVNKGHWRNAFSNYISILSDRQIFVDGNGIAQDHGVPVEDKIFAAETIFKNLNNKIVCSTIKKHKIDYIYGKRELTFSSIDPIPCVTEEFANHQIKILRVI